jgi:hypothetical protein
MAGDCTTPFCGHRRQAVCEPWSHQLGWELQLVVAPGMRRDAAISRILPTRHAEIIRNTGYFDRLMRL